MVIAVVGAVLVVVVVNVVVVIVVITVVNTIVVVVVVVIVVVIIGVVVVVNSMDVSLSCDHYRKKRNRVGKRENGCKRSKSSDRRNQADN